MFEPPVESTPFNALATTSFASNGLTLVPHTVHHSNGYGSIQQSNAGVDDLLVPSALTKAMRCRNTAISVSKRALSLVVGVATFVQYYVILTGKVDLKTLLSCIASNVILAMYCTEGTIAHISQIKNSDMRSMQKAKAFLGMIMSGLIVSVGGALIGYQQAKESPDPDIHSDFMILLSTFASGFSNLVQGMLALSSAGEVFGAVWLWLEACWGSEVAQQKLALLEVLEHMKSRMAHAPIDRFKQANPYLLEPSLVKVIFKGYHFEESNEHSALLMYNFSSEDATDSNQLLNMMNVFSGHEQAAQQKSNKSRLANASGTTVTTASKVLLNILYGGMLIGFPYVLFTSCIGSTWSGALALEDLGLSTWESLTGSIASQALNILLSMVLGVKLAKVVKNFIADLVEYGNLPHHLTTGGGWGMLLNAVFGVGLGAFTASDSGATSFTLYGQAVNCSLPSPAFLLDPAEFVRLNDQTVIEDGAIAVNGYLVIAALMALMNFLFINRFLRSPAHLNAEKASEKIDVVINELRKLSSSKVSELCTTLEDQATTETYSPLARALTDAGVFSGKHLPAANGHHSGGPTADADDAVATDSASWREKICPCL